MQLFESERAALGLPSGMQTFEREQPWSAQNQALDWNRAAAAQWSQRQAMLRGEFDGMNGGGGGPDMSREAARSYTSKTDYSDLYANSPMNDAVRSGMASPMKPVNPMDYAAQNRNYEGLYGASPFDAVNYWDEGAGVSRIPGRSVRNPEWMEGMDPSQQFITGPGRDLPRYAYEEAVQLMEPRGYRRPQQAVTQSAPDLSAKQARLAELLSKKNAPASMAERLAGSRGVVPEALLRPPPQVSLEEMILSRLPEWNRGQGQSFLPPTFSTVR